jgi:hypothetical protein
MVHRTTTPLPPRPSNPRPFDPLLGKTLRQPGLSCCFGLWKSPLSGLPKESPWSNFQHQLVGFGTSCYQTVPVLPSILPSQNILPLNLFSRTPAYHHQRKSLDCAVSAHGIPSVFLAAHANLIGSLLLDPLAPWLHGESACAVSSHLPNKSSSELASTHKPLHSASQQPRP